MSTTDEAKRESIMRKLEGILAKADPDRGATEEEAMAALAAAKRLMTQYGIDEAEVRRRSGTTESAGIGLKDIVRHEYRTGTIEHSCYRYIYQIIEELSDVQIVRSTYFEPARNKHYCKVIFIGTQDDITMAMLLWMPLKNLMRRMPPRRAKQMGVKCSCAFENGYYRGARDGILERARAQEAEAHKLADSGASAEYGLVLVKKDALIEQYMKEQMSIVYSKRRSRARADAAAYAVGQRDGRNFQTDEKEMLT